MPIAKSNLMNREKAGMPGISIKSAVYLEYMKSRKVQSECKMHKVGRKHTTSRSVVFYWLLTIGYMGIIFFLSSQNNIPLPKLPTNFDKVIHMCAYIPLAYLLYLSLKKSGISKYVFVSALILASIYGITDELHQTFVPGRDASVGDVLADTLGAFLGSFAASIKT
ncbi:MAG: VanZ family protein [Nitrospirae bacterium]|nr:VanZ family protein [Nitrospirota bacterium]